MRKTRRRLAAAALSIGLVAAGMAPALADHDVAIPDDDTWVDDGWVDEEPFRGSLGNLLRGDLVRSLPVVGGLAGDGEGLLGREGGLLGGLLGGGGGLLGPRGLVGSSGGLVPGLLGGHSSLPEFADGTGGLVDGLSALPGALAGAPPVGGGHTGENARIGDGVLSGVLDLGSILSGLTGRL